MDLHVFLPKPSFQHDHRLLGLLLPIYTAFWTDDATTDRELRAISFTGQHGTGGGYYTERTKS